ncbi:hypothetical protein LC092_03585 [Stappia stellulata]|uniref:Bug family tripartite tricarboxylate transporter substrate binding protein n=1 Tax=Stappia stellulata TaxID=71235 RepID=UPI001CD1FE16|nr:tripartite tricarboxylate transporter substrate-binding protein [Stappia stellulata]MCA1241511.1 hypothetical protein [Stappia stellulata]
MSAPNRIAATAVLAMGLASVPALAETPFYEGKTIEVLINYSAGGPTDVEARLIARYLGKHIPGNPTIIARNRAGAGGMIGMNYMADVAKPDGLTVAIFSPPVFTEVLGDAGLDTRFKDFVWLSSLAVPQICYVRRDTPPGIEDPADLLQAETFNASGIRPTSTHDIRMRLSLDVLGVDYNYVTGYKGLAGASAAVLQNEAQYSCGSIASYRSSVVPSMVETGIALPLFYYAVVDAEGNDVLDPSLPDIPTFRDYYRSVHGEDPSGEVYEVFEAVNNLKTSLQRGSFVPLGTPEEAVDALRQAWKALETDEEFLGAYEEAFQAKPVIAHGEETMALIESLDDIDADLVSFLSDYIAAGSDN